MTRTVTVGLDGSTESLAAADWAAREAVLREVPLRLVHAWVWQPPYSYTPMAGVSAPKPVVEEQRLWAESVPRKAEADLSARHPGLRVAADRISEPPVPALLAASAETDLLVLGSRGLSGLTGFLVGSVGLAVVAGTECPVVLVRAGECAEDEHRPPDAAGLSSATSPFRDVVVGLDLEHPVDAVTEFAFEAAARREAALRVVHTWTLPPYYYGYGGALDPTLASELGGQVRNALGDALRPWREKSPAVEVIEETPMGGAGPCMIDASRNACLVVVGRRHRRAPVGPHIGPVTHAVLHHSSAPVAVVPYG
ncbi:universal stress protein [Streptomyces violascens]|uniref:universal stress protein n=1 Tax=Streptomyces violascens TaxID=67381 RepID=UPI0036591594